MKQKIRTKCPHCGKSRNFYLKRQKGNALYVCHECNFAFNHINNLKTAKKLTMSFCMLLLIASLMTGCSKKVIPKEEYFLTLRISAQSQLNYTLEFNNTFLKSGILESSWNDIKVKNQEGIYRFYFWDKEHYTDSYDIQNHFRKKNDTTTKELILKDENLKGQISVSLSDKLIEKDQKDTKLIFTAENGTIKHIFYCIHSTIGILYADPKDDVSYCDQQWTNRTLFGNLTDQLYYCDNVVAKCLEKPMYKCQNEKATVPKGIYAEKCYYLGKTLMNENFEVPIHIETMDYFDPRDAVVVYVFDMELTPEKRLFEKNWLYGLNQQIGRFELR